MYFFIHFVKLMFVVEIIGVFTENENLFIFMKCNI